MTPEENAQQESLKKQTDGQDAAAKMTKRLMDAMEDLEDPVKRQARLTAETNKGFLGLDRAIKSGRTRWIDATDDIRKLAEQIEEVTDASKKAELEEKLQTARSNAKAAQRDKFLLDSFGELAKGVFNAGVGITKSVVNSYQSGASAFQTFGDAGIAAISASQQTAAGVSAAGASFAGAMALLAPETAGLSLAFGALVGVANALYQGMSELTKAGVQVAVKEIENTAKAYNSAANAGAIFTDGIMSIRSGSIEAGLTMAQLSKVINEQSQQLADFGGNAMRGVDAFKKISKQLMSNDGVVAGLIGLGYGVQDMADGMANYMAIVGSVSSKQRVDYNNLALESAKYLENLRLISAFTGNDAKKAQQAAEASAREASVDARIREETAKGNEHIAANYRLMIASLPTQAERDAYADSFGMYGAMTEKSALYMSQTGTSLQDMQTNINNLLDPTKKQGDALKAQLNLQKEHAGVIQQEIQSTQGTIGIAGKFDSTLRELGVSQQQANEFYTKLAKGDSPEKILAEMGKLKEAAADQTTATGKYAKTIQEGQALNLKVQQALDPVILQFENFASLTKDIIKNIRDSLKAAGFKLNAEPQQQKEITRPDGTKFKPYEQTQPPGGGPISGSNKPAVQLPKGTVTPELTDLLTNPVFANLVKTSLNDSNAHSGTSKHYEGKAADFSVKGLTVDQVVSKLTAIKGTPGVADVWAEDTSPDTDWAKSITAAGGKVGPYKGTAPHIHMQMLAKGGITDGPSIAGEAGPEAVVPLPDGRNIPVKVDMGDMLSKLDQMIKILGDQHDTSEKILQSSL